jgi:hypothetical protein
MIELTKYYTARSIFGSRRIFRLAHHVVYLDGLITVVTCGARRRRAFASTQREAEEAAKNGNAQREPGNVVAWVAAVQAA